MDGNFEDDRHSFSKGGKISYILLRYCAVSYSLPLASLIIGVVDGLGAGVTNTKSVLYRSCGSQQNYAPNFGIVLKNLQ